MREDEIGWLEAEESNSVIGLVELGGDVMLTGSGAVVEVKDWPAEDPEDPVWRLGFQFCVLAFFGGGASNLAVGFVWNVGRVSVGSGAAGRSLLDI